MLSGYHAVTVCGTHFGKSPSSIAQKTLTNMAGIAGNPVSPPRPVDRKAVLAIKGATGVWKYSLSWHDLSENRYTLFRIMPSLLEHDLFGKTATHFSGSCSG
jgi:hypothetical protein